MKSAKPTGEEIWGEGDWWERRCNKQKINKHLGRYGHYLPDTNQRMSRHDENIEGIFGVQEEQPKPVVGLVVLYIIGILLTKLIWGSWFIGVVWPAAAFFWALTKLIG